MSDSPDIEFSYYDTDDQANEISELYSYTEENEFTLNKMAFESVLEECGLTPRWTSLNDSQKHLVILHFLDALEASQRSNRMRVARAVLYLAQGTFGECLSFEDQNKFTRDNIFLMYQEGIFHMFMQLLNMEIENSSAATSALRKPAVSLGDSTDLRVVFSVLYMFVEVMRVSDESDTEEMEKLREAFKVELAQPIIGDELLAITLFQMVTKFCSGSAPHFPIKKVLLLLWKTILVSLGGTDELRTLKAKYREDCELLPVPDDTIEVARTMRAASPPASAADLIEQQQQRKNLRPFKRVQNSVLT